MQDTTGPTAPAAVDPAAAPAAAAAPAPRIGCGQIGCLTLLALGVLGAIMNECGGSASGDGDGSTSSGPSASMAYVMCRQYVEQRLRAPSTAKFPGFMEETYSQATTALGGGSYRVTSWVDAQNGFGAMLRNHYVCKVTYTGGDNWRLDDLEMSAQ